MTTAMSTGPHNLSAVAIIILALIIGVVIYFTSKRRSNPPNGSA
jgi:LPXTG-motif cell wall-anchored protein